MEFDYVIIGSGAGGSVLAERLSVGSSATVLVIEAGGSDRHPVHLVPKGFFFTMHAPRYAKKFVAGPYGPNGRVDEWWRGRVVGGSTTINGLVWNRGWAPDYDQLVHDGNPNWGWPTFLDAFRQIENFQLGASDLHGDAGRVPVEIPGPPETVSEMFMESAGLLGLRRVVDINGSDDQRVGYTQVCTRNGTRVSAARAFLRPALKRPNVTLMTHAEVGQILLDGNQAVGVRVRHKDQQIEVRARREVLLCGGSLDSPLVLERSGIGRAEVLAAAGIELLVESPNVGERLNEHRGLHFMYSISGAEGYNHLVNTQPRQLITGAKYLARRQGIISEGSAKVLAYLTADEGSQRPDTIGFFNPISTASWREGGLQVDKQAGLMLAVYPLRPTSLGSIHSMSADPADAARIDPNTLSTVEDRRIYGKAMARVRELFATGPLAKIITQEHAPGPAATEDEYLSLDAQRGAWAYHPLGTCGIGPNDDDVVDASLRVRGVEGLRIVDASVFRHQPSGNTSAPTQALAWHAASLILRDS